MNQTNRETDNGKRRPDEKIVVGAVSAAIWRETAQSASGHDYTKVAAVIERSYRDDRGGWQQTNRYGSVRELMQLRLVVDRTIERLLDSERGEDA
ncbi:MAG: hypothetical protein AAFZ67_11370 [Planctomycetota bacterium]